MSKITPLGPRVLVKPEEIEEKTKGGLIIPDTVGEEKPSTGVVVKLGTGDEDTKFDVKEGDNVVFKKYATEEIELDDEILYVIEYKDIIAVIK